MNTSQPIEDFNEDEAPQEPTGRDFSLTNEKIRINAEVIKMSWCPTMDLLAILTVESKIFIHRFLTWQKLFTITSDDNINFNDIQWRPDGK